MKISIKLTENIINRIHTIFDNILFPKPTIISEFDDAEYKISKQYSIWLNHFERKEKLLEITVELSDQLSALYQRHKINQLQNTVNKNKHMISMLQKLASYQPKHGKNQILSHLTKQSNSNELATVETSIFTDDNILNFNSFLQELHTDQQDLLDRINTIKTKPLVELSEQTLNTLVNEKLIKGAGHEIKDRVIND